MKETLFGISAKVFFAEYAPNVSNYTHKMRGIDGNGKPIDFTDEDLQLIIAGMRAMFEDKLKACEKALKVHLQNRKGR